MRRVLLDPSFEAHEVGGDRAQLPAIERPAEGGHAATRLDLLGAGDPAGGGADVQWIESRAHGAAAAVVRQVRAEMAGGRRAPDGVARAAAAREEEALAVARLGSFGIA